MLMVAGLFIGHAAADIPQVVTFQAQLTDTLGNPVPDGNYTATFRIYDASEGGNILWSYGPVTGPIEDGLFTLNIGNDILLPDDLFANYSNLWLGITVNEDPEMQPRVKFTSVPYAYQALRADTAEVALNAGDESGWSDSGNIVSLVTGTDSVGIGTVTPEAKLHIMGDLKVIGQANIGGNNTNSGDQSFVAGENNNAQGDGSTIGGGAHNLTGDDYAVVSGGYSDTAETVYSTVSGGAFNAVYGSSSTIGGGEHNRATNGYATIGGGAHNVTTAAYSIIPGGYADTITAAGDYSVLFGIGSKLSQDSTFMVDFPHIWIGPGGGGYELTSIQGTQGQVLTLDGNDGAVWMDPPTSTSADSVWRVADSVAYTRMMWGLAKGNAYNALYGSQAFSMVNLGYACTTGVSGMNAQVATVSGGGGNAATSDVSTVSGGATNRAAAYAATVGGGEYNRSTGNYSIVSGGHNNQAIGYYSAVGGGEGNRADSGSATVAGGTNNIARGRDSFVGSGVRNDAGPSSAIAGGEDNTTNGLASFVGAGQNNTITGSRAIIGSGWYNYVAGDYSAILGGFADTVAESADLSYLFGINSNMTQDSTFMVDMPHIRFGDEATGYDFPTADGVEDQVMVTDGWGNLTWQDFGGGLDSNSVTSREIADGTIVDDDIADWAAIKPYKISGTAAVLDTNLNVFNGGATFGGKVTCNSRLVIGLTDPAVAQVEVFTQSNNAMRIQSASDYLAFSLTALNDAAHIVSTNGYGLQVEALCDTCTALIAKGGADAYAARFQGNVLLQRQDTGEPILELGEGLDYAEGFDVADERDIELGMVVVIDPCNPGKLKLSTAAYDRKVAGIVAGANNLGSGVRLGAGRYDHDIALAGRVYCNVDASQSGIEPGDLLTTSDKPGFAMKVSDYARAQGAILGKAMEPIEQGRTGQILVLVTLQ